MTKSWKTSAKHPKTCSSIKPSGPPSNGSIPIAILPSATTAEFTGSSASPWNRERSAPTGFMFAGSSPDLDGHYRRSYVLWKEHVKPAVLIEYSSEDGTKKHDRTPFEGKFWIYEQAVQGAFYAIFVVKTGELEVHRLRRGRYRRMAPNKRGHYKIEPLGVNLGVWQGLFYNEMRTWLRWYDNQGNLLPISDERAEQERLKAEQAQRNVEQAQRNAEQERFKAEQERLKAKEERQRADSHQRRADNLAARLRELGLDPAAIEADSHQPDDE